jgi:molybdopterin/thiamine biosynthesis adenylyltransferase
MKSKVAAEVVKLMNPNMHIRAYGDGVLPETEHVYDHFFERLDGVVNALDNVKARKYLSYINQNVKFFCFVKVNTLIVVVFIIKNH